MKRWISLIAFVPVLAQADPTDSMSGTNIHLDASSTISMCAEDEIRLATNCDSGTTSVYVFDDDASVGTGGAYVIKVDGDSNRLFTFDASSDTALTLTFGDGSTTANQIFLIAGAGGVDDDDTRVLIAGGSSASTGEGAIVEVYGNETTANGLLALYSGADSGSDIQMYPFDDLTFFLSQDANRLITFDSSSDTALKMTFGDGGTTANQVLVIAGGAGVNDDDTILGLTGGSSIDEAEGAYVYIYGNEASGDVLISAGDTANADVALGMQAATSTVRIQDNTAGTLWAFENDGDLAQDATNGGSIVLSKTSTGFASTVANSVTAAGTTVTDATQLTAVWNRVSTVAASTGVKLWDTSNGIEICVQNAGANNLELYPPTSGATINAAGAGAGITLAAATDDIACCVETASTQWFCTLDAGPAT